MTSSELKAWPIFLCNKVESDKPKDLANASKFSPLLPNLTTFLLASPKLLLSFAILRIISFISFGSLILSRLILPANLSSGTLTPDGVCDGGTLGGLLAKP